MKHITVKCEVECHGNDFNYQYLETCDAVLAWNVTFDLFALFYFFLVSANTLCVLVKVHWCVTLLRHSVLTCSITGVERTTS